jgi:hypothetical protein
LQKLVESGGVVGFGGVVEGQAIEFGGGGGHLDMGVAVGGSITGATGVGRSNFVKIL